MPHHTYIIHHCDNASYVIHTSYIITIDTTSYIHQSQPCITVYLNNIVIAHNDPMFSWFQFQFQQQAFRRWVHNCSTCRCHPCPSPSSSPHPTTSAASESARNNLRVTRSPSDEVNRQSTDSACITTTTGRPYSRVWHKTPTGRLMSSDTFVENETPDEIFIRVVY